MHPNGFASIKKIIYLFKVRFYMIKVFLLAVLILLLLTGWNRPVPLKDPGNNLSFLLDTMVEREVRLSANGYIQPAESADSLNLIDGRGLSHWSDRHRIVRVYFYPQHTGRLVVRLKMNPTIGRSTIRVRLDSSGPGHLVHTGGASGELVQTAGEFEVGSIRYHCIEISGMYKQGPYFPDLSSLIFSGPAAKDLLYNTSEYRGAASTHLRYPIPGDSAAAWFYTEVSVPTGVDADNAYYETNGFADGYMGIQVNSPRERRFIFSIWSNYKTDDPARIPSDYAVKLVKKGADVFTGEFGNEGSGGHSHLVFMWKPETVYKLLVGAKPAGDHTIFTAYFYAPENGKWQLLAQWDKSRTGGQLLKGLYAFVENFGDNGNDYFRARYGNQWICTPSGNWLELTRCMLTTTASPSRHPRYDYGAGVENNWFYMFTGGFRDMNNLEPHSQLVRKPGGVPPLIDFEALPQH